jgi:hypothetical protein
LPALDGHELGAAAEAADLLALAATQDVEPGDDGVFRIARKTAAGRVISTVDIQARHGHKSRNRRFGGYKAHLSIDPDCELIDEVAATAANTPGRDAAARLLDELAAGQDKPEVIGDSAYGDAATRAALEEQGFTVIAKCPPARNSGGRFAKDQFTISREHGTVTCPAGQTAVITPASGGGGRASFRPWCAACPLRPACTASRRGRTIAIHPREDVLQRARAEAKARRPLGRQDQRRESVSHGRLRGPHIPISQEVQLFDDADVIGEFQPRQGDREVPDGSLPPMLRACSPNLLSAAGLYSTFAFRN